MLVKAASVKAAASQVAPLAAEELAAKESALAAEVLSAVLPTVVAELVKKPKTHIKLIVEDQQGSQMSSRVSESTTLRKLMTADCSRVGLQVSQVRFVVDGD
jgi:hypothetical protein